MRIPIILLIAIVIMAACNSGLTVENENAVLLTSTTWKTGEGKKSSSTKFNTDGTFTVKFSAVELEIRGVWEWISPTELSMQDTELVLNGTINRSYRKSTDKTIIRITSLSSGKLVSIEHHILDAEDSGFAKTCTYTPE